MRIITCPSAQNVVEGDTVTQDLPVGNLVYEMLQVDMGGTTFLADDILNISLKADGNEIQFFESGTVLQDINDYYTRPANTAALQLFLSRPEMVRLTDQRITGLATNGLASLVLSGDLSGTTAPTMVTRRAVTGLRKENAIPLVTKVKRFTYAPGAAGEVECSNIRLGPRIIAIHFYKSDVDSVIIQDEESVIYRGDKTELEYMQEAYGRTPQSAVMTTVDFCLDNDLSQALETTRIGRDNVERARALRILPTVGSSGSMPVYVEYLDRLGNP